ncbi:MAG: hypothetical protein AAGD96_01980 [Chloroflexota bacterium]
MFNLIWHLVKVGFWLGIALIIIELGLRLFIESPPIRYGYDEDWGYYPDQGTFIIWGSEGYGVNWFGTYGEQTTPNNNGPNIVVLGDSHTESHQVGYDQNFVSIAENELVNNGFTYNLRNHGKAYSSVADYIYLAPVVEEIYSPELVVIQLSVQDFFKNEVYDKNKVNHFVAGGSEKSPSLELVHNPPPFNDHWLGKIMQNTVLLVQGTKQKRLLFDGGGNQPAATEQAGSSKVATDVIDTQLDMLQEAYAGSDLIIILLPYTPLINGDEVVFEEDIFIDLLNRFDNYPEWRVINPSTEFDQLYIETGTLPRGFSNSSPGTGHLNRDGHEVVGALLAEQIDKVLR